MVAVEVADEAVDERAELAHDHLAAPFGDQGKGVALLADAGGQGRAEQGGVHLHPRVAKGVLDDVERDQIDRGGRRKGALCWFR